MQKATKNIVLVRMNVFFDSQFKYRKKIESSKEIPKIIYYDKESSFQKQPPEVFYKKGVLRIFTKSTRKHLCQGLFFTNLFYRTHLDTPSQCTKTTLFAFDNKRRH